MGISRLQPVNKPPEKPPRPKGPRFGKPNMAYDFIFGPAYDPDNDDIFYVVDWYNDDYDGDYISKSYKSGQEACIDKSFDAGSIKIRVKAVDIFGAESEWSDPLSVSMPKNKPSSQGTLMRLVDMLRVRVRVPLVNLMCAYVVLPP